jgi:IS605 OrfB family transposase
VANARADAHHKFTTNLVRRFNRIVIEDLAVGNMVKNRRLSRATSDAGWATIRQQLTYKCKLAGVELVVAPRFFASSQTCSGCGHRLAVNLTLKDRVFKCPVCALEIDRDMNAAKNLAGFEPADAPVTASRKTCVLDLCKSFPQGEAGLPEGVNIGSTLTGGVSATLPATAAAGGN